MLSKKNIIETLGLGVMVLVSFSLASAQVASSVTSVPQVASISPAFGQVGTEVIIVGSGFTGNSLVVFGAGAVVPTSVNQSGTQLQFTVPAALLPLCRFNSTPCDTYSYAPAPGTYLISVSADSSFKVLSNGVRFDLPPNVAITNISPISGPVGTEVTIVGYGFSEYAANAINFGSNGVIAQFSNSTSVIKFVIPLTIMPRCMLAYKPCSSSLINLSPGVYAVSVSPNFDFSQVSGRTTNRVSFTLTSGSVSVPAPVITSISPTSGSIGTQVTIKGSNFSPNLNVVAFDSGGVALLRPSGNDLTFTVPASLFPQCAIFGDPPCQAQSPNVSVTLGVHTLRVMRDANTVSNSVQFTVSSIPIPASTPDLPVSSLLGGRVESAADLNVRSNPSLSATIVGVEKSGSLGGVTDGPVSADGYEWLQVSWEDGLGGWSAGKYLVGRGSSPCPILAGHRIYVVAGRQALILYLRSYPSVNAPIVGGELPVVGGTVVSGPVVADRANWWQLKFDDGVTGWAKESDFIDTSCYSYESPPPPPQPTAVSISSPRAGATLSGVVSVTVSVSSGAAISEVDFYVDGALAGVVSAPPYTWNWDVTQVLNGNHTLYAEAKAGGFIAKSSVVFMNVVGGISLPTVTFTSPKTSSVVSGVVPVTVSVSSAVPVTEVEFYVDGRVANVAKVPPYTWNWDSTQVYNGWHSLGAVARTTNPAISGSKTIGVNVTGGMVQQSPTVITVSFVTPQAGAAVSGAVTLTATVSASSPVSIVSVDFYNDGTLIGSADSAPYAVSWDATQVLNGTHALLAVANAAQASGDKTIFVNVTGGLSLPVVTFTTPRAGAAVSGAVPVSVVVPANNPPVTEVDFYIDGILANVAKVPPYTWNWDSTQVYNGWHSLGAVARTTNPAISVSKTIGVNVTGGIVAPAMTLSFTNPKSGTNVWGTVRLAASVVSTVPTSEVDFYVDGTLLGAVKNPPYVLSWDTTQVQTGFHTLTAVAKAVGASASQSVSVNVMPPPLFSVGDRVKVQTDSNFGLNVRLGPSLGFSIIGSEPNGTLGTIASGPVFADAFFWWTVNYDNGVSGWSVESYLVKAP